MRFNGIDSLPQTKIFKSLYLCELIIETFDISNLAHLILQKYPRSTTLGCKDIRIKNSEFVAKTQTLYIEDTFRAEFLFWFEFYFSSKNPIN